MKDILVEFTDNGAIIHKDPSVIAAKRDMSYCFFNPDLSKVSGVSPSYWVYSANGEIVPASPEERARRDEYHTNKPPENTVSLKQTLDSLRQELSADMEQNVADLKCVNEQIINSIETKNILMTQSINDIKYDIEEAREDAEVCQALIGEHLAKQDKEIKYLKIALGISVLLTTILKLI